MAAPHELADLTAGFKRRLGLFQMVVKLYRLDTFSRLRLQRGAEHITHLGSRVVAEYLAEVSETIGGLPAILRLLGEYEHRLNPAVLRATGGDRFPRRLVEVPR